MPNTDSLVIREVKIKHINVRIRISRNHFITIYEHFKTRLLKIRVTEGGDIIIAEKKGYTRMRAFKERKAHKGRGVARHIHSFIKHSLINYNVPQTITDTWETLMNTTGKQSLPSGTYILAMEDKQYI